MIAEHLSRIPEYALLLPPALAFSKKLKEKVRNLQYGLCDMCKQPAKLQIHHRIPQSQGGADDIENSIGLCISCHKIVDAETQKGIIYPQRFYKEEDEGS